MRLEGPYDTSRTTNYEDSAMTQERNDGDLERKKKCSRRLKVRFCPCISPELPFAIVSSYD